MGFMDEDEDFNGLPPVIAPPIAPAVKPAGGDDELAALEAAQSRAEGIKGLMGVAGGVLDQVQSIPTSHQLLYGGKARSPTASKILGAAADGISDPMERKRKAMEFIKNKREMSQAAEADKVDGADANSYRMFLEDAVPTMKGKTAGMTYQQMKNGAPLLEARFRAMEQEKLARIAAGAHAAEKADAKAEKAALDQKERTTSYGVARTADDAKKLKEASELKENFDGKLQEMIALREKHGGGQILDRTDQARGKALSDDLLLAYKDLSKLGVMSKTDEAILRRIIPSDPLQYNSPLAAIQGQDPTMNQMKKFKGDSEKDFQARLKNRLENYQGEKQVAKKQINKKTGETRVVYSDGTSEIIPSTAGR